jgi:hypothetical protein
VESLGSKSLLSTLYSLLPSIIQDSFDSHKKSGLKRFRPPGYLTEEEKRETGSLREILLIDQPHPTVRQANRQGVRLINC